MKKVHLFLKHKWWDMIASGVKQEEYRDNTQRYQDMLENATHVILHRAYTKTTMEREIVSKDLGYGNPSWGAPTDREVFIIKLKKI